MSYYTLDGLPRLEGRGLEIHRRPGGTSYCISESPVAGVVAVHEITEGWQKALCDLLWDHRLSFLEEMHAGIDADAATEDLQDRIDRCIAYLTGTDQDEDDE